MLIGGMNHPGKDLLNEISEMASLGMDFIDLTLEPPCAASWNIDPVQIRKLLLQHEMGVVGHTPWYLPLASAVPELRQGAVQELRRSLQKFAEIGAKWMNIHPDRGVPWHDRRFWIEGNLESLALLLQEGKKLGVGVMIENLPGDFNSASQLGELLDPLPDLMLHLDIGHANLRVPRNTTDEILAAYSKRLRHVHLHDNRGGEADLHLPLGTGSVNFQQAVCALKKHGYDGTITLEVFTPDKHHLIYSRDLLRQAWSA